MSLLNLLNQTVTIYRKSSYDEFARENYAAGVQYRARVREVTKSVRLPDGKTVVIDAICFLDESPTVNMDDKIIYNGITYKVYGRKVAVDGSGKNHHTRLELIKSN